MDTGKRRQSIERASVEWRSSLIDVSGSNRLLFFKPTVATLDLTDIPVAAMAELLAGRTMRLSKLVPVTRLVAAQRACKALAAKQREASEAVALVVAARWSLWVVGESA